LIQKNSKKRIKGTLHQDYDIEFLGDNFDEITKQLTDSKADKINRWIEEVILRRIQPITIGSNQKYKKWPVNQLLIFRYPFTIGNSEYRILLVKVKNAIYIEFHLGDHKYYDDVRKELGVKKGNY